MRTVLTFILFTLFIGGINAQEKTSKTKVAFIKTNAQCGDCKQRIEKVLNFEKGISYAELHIDTKTVEVKYNSKRTSLEKIKETISKIGYSADEVEANKEAQAKLPMCCQPGGHD